MTDVFFERLSHEAHRELFHYWDSKRQGDRLPSRTDIDPIDIPHLLSCLALIEVFSDVDPVDFRYRLAGTEIVKAAGREPSGKTFRELYSGDHLEGAIQTYNDIRERAAPHISRRIFRNDACRRCLNYDRMILPLASKGQTVDMFILHVVFVEIRNLNAI